ncbi:S-layer homology domain-containing protein, partial [Cyanobium sp. CH-040]|nr:S-layer homology domain-containing protein [Cyanobium sp. CH-040]
MIAVLVAGHAGAAAAPLSPADTPALNLAAIEQYAGPALSGEQVTSISQFSDVRPTDWAYQALSNLIERYGCVAGYPDG